jgi:hypothetical protein
MIWLIMIWPVMMWPVMMWARWGVGAPAGARRP